MKIIMVIAGAILLFLSVWLLLYPSRSDPKNIQYILWKAGLWNMNLDAAAQTMIGDADAEKLVLGRTEEQVRGRFGYLLLPADATPYLRNCYQGSAWKAKEVRFIRQSPWMIVFESDRAVKLVLIKGC